MLANFCEKSYSVDARYANFYSGGDIEWTVDGSQLYCLNGNEVFVVDVATGQELRIYSTESNDRKKPDEEGEEDPTYCFALSALHLVTAHRSGLLRLWELATGKLIKLWKAQHKGPVVKIAFNASGHVICSSGGDSTLRLWDWANSSCLGVLNDFSGPATILKFHPSELKREIYAVGSDNVIYCWNYGIKKLVRTLRGHLSQVTGISFQNEQENCQNVATVSRDKVLILWQLENDSAKQLKVLPLYEELVGVAYLGDGKQLVVLCGTGKLLLIHGETSKITQLIPQSDFEVNGLLYSSAVSQLAIVTTEQNILTYRINEDEPEKIVCVKQLVGYNDEILDMCFLGVDDRYIAVATNSKHLKLYDTQDDMNCKLIPGHKDTIMSLTSTQNLLLSAGKDCSIMLWQLANDTFALENLMQQSSCHTSTIGCITFAQQIEDGFASVSQDGSLKVWTLLKDKKDKTYSFSIRYAALAHDKEINCVTYSPNSKIIATASQDKTVKLWRNDANTTMGVLRGHTRGVSCVRFSPVDQIVLTTSADSSLRIWSVANFTCLKRLEQECTVLRAEFVDHGKFILSASTDGILKLWNIKTNNCVQSIDEHSERVWTLAVPKHTNKYFFSGGSDSKLIRFIDVTQATRNEAIDKHQAALQEEQTLQSLLHQRKNLQRAFVLALTLGKPKTTYNIISDYVRQRNEATVKDIVSKLNIDQRVTLLEHVKAWSTNSRHSLVSNIVLQNLLGDALVESTSRLYNYSNMVEVLTPYVQRHFKRITELTNELAYLEFILKCM